VGVKTIKHREVALARDAKRMGHALGDQTLNQQVASDSCGHKKERRWAVGHAESVNSQTAQ
jgi:hypothetical protein